MCGFRTLQNAYSIANKGFPNRGEQISYKLSNTDALARADPRDGWKWGGRQKAPTGGVSLAVLVQGPIGKAISHCGL